MHNVIHHLCEILVHGHSKIDKVRLACRRRRPGDLLVVIAVGRETWKRTHAQRMTSQGESGHVDAQSECCTKVTNDMDSGHVDAQSECCTKVTNDICAKIKILDPKP
jgi:hypothetical protein